MLIARRQPRVRVDERGRGAGEDEGAEWTALARQADCPVGSSG